METVVAGGTGFIGRSLVPELQRAGHAVRVATREPDRYHGPGDPVYLDADDATSMREAVEGCEVVYYLLHALGEVAFEDIDRRRAEELAAAAADAGVERVVYLGGLGERGAGSAHLRSRHEVGDILAAAIATVELRASLVLGPGGASYELVRQLVRQLTRLGSPVVPAPSALAARTQPIALEDAVAYLVHAARLDPGTYDIGAPDVVSYAELMETEARLQDHTLRVLPTMPVPPRSFAPFAALLTDQDGLVAHALFDSAGEPAVVEERRIEQLTGHRPLSVEEALRRAAA